MTNQKGITLVGAIFVLVIVSLLGQYLINITGVQRQTSIMTLQGARAYQAANTGLEWGIDRIINGPNICPANQVLQAPAIANFNITVNCLNLGVVNEDGVTRTIYRLTSESTYGVYGQQGFVSRELQTTVHFP